MDKAIKTQSGQTQSQAFDASVADRDRIRAAFAKAEEVDAIPGQNARMAVSPSKLAEAASETQGSQAAGRDTDALIDPPVVPLGHSGGKYHFISPCGELREMSAERLEAGRGVKALFAGMGPDVEEWCRREFSGRNNDWCQKQAGFWIIEQCNVRGVFDPSTADLRSIGVWRDGKNRAFAHCGDKLVFPDGRTELLAHNQSRFIAIGASPISVPAFDRLAVDDLMGIFHKVGRLWGWRREADVIIWFGWVAAACLGGFPVWRTHLYIHGNHGSGKSKLIELAACLLGELAGEVMNDASEAGLRQSRNNQARPLLIDEFEPDDNQRNAARQDNLLALIRRMSGDKGGRISRGRSDHSSVSFRLLGPAYLTSINHIHLEPQDRSRFAVLGLRSLPKHSNPGRITEELGQLFTLCEEYSARFRGRMLQQSVRWDITHMKIAARAQSLGANPRQASTAATLLAGYDLAMFDGEIDDLRLQDLDDALAVLITDSSEANEEAEGQEVLDRLLSATLTLDHGLKRTIRELVDSAVDRSESSDGHNAEAALKRYGVYLDVGAQIMRLRSGKNTPTAELFANTKWRNGAHASAMVKLDGVVRPTSAIRLSKREQYRVIEVPFSCLGFSDRS